MSSEVAELERVVAEVPDGWRRACLGDLCRINIGGTPPRHKSEYWAAEGDGHLWVSISDLRQPVVVATKERITDAGVANSNVKLVKAGTIMMSFKLTIGRVAVAGTDLFTNEAIAAFVPVSGIDKSFLPYWLARIVEDADTDQAIKGVTLNKQKLAMLSGLLPPLDDQRRIAEVLRSVDEAIASNQQCLTQAGAVRAALLQRHFHMAEWADGQPLPDGWEMPLLDAVATRGSGHTPNKKIDSYWNGGIKWVSLQDTKKLDQVYISTTAQQISDDGIRNSSAVLHPDGVVVISRDATVGRSAITVGPMAVSQHFIAYRCGKTLNNHYFYYWLQRMKPVFERIGAGSTIKTIGLPFFKSLRIALPPLQEQSQIVDVMLDADRAMMSAAAAIQSLQKVKEVVMADLLSGRARVPA